jgi:hypothetical protein
MDTDKSHKEKYKTAANLVQTVSMTSTLEKNHFKDIFISNLKMNLAYTSTMYICMSTITVCF